jgi:uncharacterized coiled-coil DUF342 family protein
MLGEVRTLITAVQTAREAVRAADGLAATLLKALTGSEAVAAELDQKADRLVQVEARLAELTEQTAALEARRDAALRRMAEIKAGLP